MTDRTLIEYNAEIERRACDIIDSGDLDAITAQMTPIDLERYRHNLRVIVACRMTGSSELAAKEIRSLIKAAAKKCARVQYYSEMQIESQRLALERFYSHVGVPA
jgi:hypothetical protein